MTAAEPIFALRNVSKTFGHLRVLDQIDLQIMAGERVALIGPSGAGKSTLISLLNGTLHPSTGTVSILGQQLSRLPPRARRRLQSQIGTIYQQFYLVDNLSVIHNVNAGQLARWSLFKALVSLVWPLETATAAQALEQVGIPEKLYARTAHLSGGQQQRVALARVLVQDPKAILADEPISNLDPERGREIMDLLRDLSQQTGKTLVASLHAVDLVQSHFDRVIGLQEGQLCFDCPTAELTPDMIEELYRIDHAVDEMAEGLEARTLGIL